MVIGVLLSLCLVPFFFAAVSQLLGGDLVFGLGLSTALSICLFLFGFIFNLGYKKEYGLGLFEEDINHLNILSKREKNISSMQLPSQPIMVYKWSAVLLGIIIIFSIVYIMNEDTLMPTRVILFSLFFFAIGNLFRKRIEFSNDLQTYSRTLVFYSFPYSYKWYDLPEMEKLSIRKENFTQSGVMFPVKVGSYSSSMFHLVIVFKKTKELLYLTSASNPESLKSTRKEYNAVLGF